MRHLHEHVREAGGLSRCAGYKSSSSTAKASHRRLGPALSIAALPSVVVLDVSAAAVSVRTLLDGDSVAQAARQFLDSPLVDASVTPPEVGTVTRRGGEARGRAGGRKRILKRERRVEADRGLSLSDGRQQ